MLIEILDYEVPAPSQGAKQPELMKSIFAVVEIE